MFAIRSRAKDIIAKGTGYDWYYQTSGWWRYGGHERTRLLTTRAAKRFVRDLS